MRGQCLLLQMLCNSEREKIHIRPKNEDGPFQVARHDAKGNAEREQMVRDMKLTTKTEMSKVMITEE